MILFFFKTTVKILTEKKKLELQWLQVYIQINSANITNNKNNNNSDKLYL